MSEPFEQIEMSYLNFCLSVAVPSNQLVFKILLVYQSDHSLEAEATREGLPIGSEGLRRLWTRVDRGPPPDPHGCSVSWLYDANSIKNC